MNTHEYQAKMILGGKYGIPVPEQTIVSTFEEVEKALEFLDLNEAVVKIQVHAGGRGKGGGVKIAKSRDEILQHCQQMLGMHFRNVQTGKEGVVVNQLLISPLVKYKKEYYVGAVIDRKEAAAILIVSPEGGMDIEEVAEKYPDKLMQVPIGLDGKLRNYQFIQLAKFMGWEGDVAEQGKQILAAVARAFMECDASLVEINPLVLTEDDQLLALDAKLSIDDNALYRQPEIAELYDPSQLSPYEVQAREFDLAYVALDGEIGCMVNGAGLAMATMDLIHHYGGTPANFLDVGGGASEEKVAEGFKIILADSKVKAILVNIFGGIMNCLTLALGIVSAAKELGVRVPLIVRMEGTNVEQGRKLLEESPLNIILAGTMEEAAQKAIQAAKKG
jgi:succinyl-CoA synthetase beta subunit